MNTIASPASAITASTINAEPRRDDGSPPSRGASARDAPRATNNAKATVARIITYETTRKRLQNGTTACSHSNEAPSVDPNASTTQAPNTVHQKREAPSPGARRNPANASAMPTAPR